VKRNSPTSLMAIKRPKKRPRALRRVKQRPPEIWVNTKRELWKRRLVLAHLRNKRGYIYLCWREGKRVRNFYLGKAPRSCPTTRAEDLPAIARSSKKRA
jgi:hypothetical protein